MAADFGGSSFAVLTGEEPRPGFFESVTSELFPGGAQVLLTDRRDRPWLVGRLAPGELVHVRSGRDLIALIGCTAASRRKLTRLLEHTATWAEVERVLAARVPGSYHVLTRFGEVTTVRGTISGTRRVFHTRIGGVTVAADRADVLAGARGADLDERRLAVSRLAPRAPAAMARKPLWRGISAVPEHACLILGETVRTAPWWWPPSQAWSLGQGASVVREALRAAVKVRTGSPLTVPGPSSLGFLAERFGEQVTQLGHSARLASVGQTDEPAPELRLPAGPEAVLSGFGGDEVLIAPLGYLNALSRRNPREAMRRLAVYRTRCPWSRTAALRLLTDRRELPEWWSHRLRKLRKVPAAGMPLPGQWGDPFHLPPWATERDAQLVRALAAEIPVEPWSSDRGQHAAIDLIQQTGMRVRILAQAIGDITLHAPFLDDHVISAALAVRTEERANPWVERPLLVESLRGIVPEQILARDEFAAERAVLESAPAVDAWVAARSSPQLSDQGSSR